MFPGVKEICDYPQRRHLRLRWNRGGEGDLLSPFSGCRMIVRFHVVYVEINLKITFLCGECKFSVVVLFCLQDVRVWLLLLFDCRPKTIVENFLPMIFWFIGYYVPLFAWHLIWFLLLLFSWKFQIVDLISVVLSVLSLLLGYSTSSRPTWIVPFYLWFSN